MWPLGALARAPLSAVWRGFADVVAPPLPGWQSTARLARFMWAGQISAGGGRCVAAGCTRDERRGKQIVGTRRNDAPSPARFVRAWSCQPPITATYVQWVLFRGLLLERLRATPNGQWATGRVQPFPGRDDPD